MAARNLNSGTKAFMRDLVNVFGKCVGAAAADPTGVKGLGITSITRVSSGKYRITLTDKYNALVMAKFTVIDSTGLRHYSVTVSINTVDTTKLIEFDVFGAATTVAPARSDLATTDTLLIELMLSNSAQKPTGY